MSEADREAGDVRQGVSPVMWLLIGGMAAVALPGILLRLTGTHPDPAIGVIIFGLAVLAAAFLLSWGAETAEMRASAQEALVIRREWEAARGITTVGPHRDDLRLRLDGRELRAYGSRGQHLSAMLAVRLAERRVLREESGEDQVLLLDDVLLTLDEERQAYLLDAIHGCQAFLTVTALGGVSRLPEGTGVFRVDAGTVTQIHAHLA